VLDLGITISEVRRTLAAERPAEVLVAVLASKQVDAPARPAVDFVGFVTSDVYLFGCGMDYKGFWRGLPALYAVTS
jgi:hypoxanthine phosphoribosyltransferase